MAARWTPDRTDPACYPGPGLDLPVLFGDLDTNLHVNNVMTGRFFEESRVDSHFRADVPAMLHRAGLRNRIARVAIDYVREARYRLPLHVRLRVSRLGRTSAITSRLLGTATTASRSPKSSSRADLRLAEHGAQ
jgi:hypothetical protein